MNPSENENKVVEGAAADSNANNASAGQPSAETKKETISQTSKRAKRILNALQNGKRQSNGNKPAKKPAASKKGEKKEEKKISKKPASKESKITLASKLDMIVKRGGKWDTLIAKANAASKELGATTKFTRGTLRGHINYRLKTQKKANFLGKLVLTDDGVVAKAKVIKKEEVAA